MKTKTELKAIVKKWWVYNGTLAQQPEAKYFLEQIGDWESGFKNYTKEGWSADSTEFEVQKVKDVKGGLAITLVGEEVLDGVLDTKTGVFTEKNGSADTETVVFIGARMESGQ
jgi:hypothetical protein